MKMNWRGQIATPKGWFPLLDPVPEGALDGFQLDHEYGHYVILSNGREAIAIVK